MEVITFDSDAFKEIMQKINAIHVLLRQQPSPLPAEINNDTCIDTQDLSDALNISTRTLQRLRTEGLLRFDFVKHRCRYRVMDVCKLLDNQTIQCDYDRALQFRRKYLYPLSAPVGNIDGEQSDK